MWGSFSLRRPRAALAGWFAGVVVLAGLGLGVEDRLVQSTLTVSGTESEKALEIFIDRFGPSATVPVLLEGPKLELERQGPALVEALADEEDIRVTSPWDEGLSDSELRPRPNAAMVLTSVEGPSEDIFDKAGPRVIDFVDERVEAPVEARVTGMPVIGNGLKEESYATVREAERIAAPALFIVLLLVFGSPVAAAIPALIGITSVLSSFGVIWLLAGSLEIDPIAITLASMMGLALGVDYSLLLVSRFREELGRGRGVVDSSRFATQTAGRTVLFAALTLTVAMIFALLVAPGSLLLSAAIGVITATVVSVIAASVAIPAALALLGANIDRWSLRRGEREGAPFWLGALGRVLRAPGIAAIAIAIPFAMLAAPALGIETGPPDVRSLPEDTRARQDFERVQKVMGPGWSAAYTVVVAAEEGVITNPDRLRAIDRWEREVEGFDDVEVVVGPGAFRPQVKQIRAAQRDLERGREGLAQLDDGLGQAGEGVSELRAGIGEASDAAGQIAAGTAGAREQSAGEDPAAALAALSAGLSAATDGAAELRAGTRKLTSGSRELSGGLTELADAINGELAPGIHRLAKGLGPAGGELGRLAEPARIATDELTDAFRRLQNSGLAKLDPDYRRITESVGTALGALTGRDPLNGAVIRQGYRGLARELRAAASQLDKAGAGAKELRAGVLELSAAVSDLAGGAKRLTRGLAEADAGAAALTDGLAELQAGVAEGLGGSDASLAELVAGLSRLDAGASELAAGLDEGARRSGELESGVERLGKAAGRFRSEVERASDEQAERIPGFFESGQFILAAIDGARERDRERAEFAINLSRGGQAGQITVIPSEGPNEPSTQALRDRLVDAAGDLAEDADAVVAVGGPAAHLADYDEATSKSLPILIGGLIGITFLVLIPVFRSILLPLIAVGLNALTVGASFALLSFLFQGENPILGGPGYIDAVAISGIFTVTFGLSIDYQVFLLSRMREGWMRTLDADLAIRYGLEKTASVVTGAAAIMIAVFVAFSFADVTSIRQFGVGLSLAIILDATVLRLVLLPALMGLAGERIWWLPEWLDRRLPELDVEGTGHLFAESSAKA